MKEVSASTRISLLHDDQTPAGFAEHVEIPKSVRRSKALKGFAPFGALALLCLPIPLMHFLLVPMFLALGAVKAWSYLSASGEITRGEVHCPRCKEKVLFGQIPENWPLKLLCEKCGYPLRLYRKTQ